MSAKARSGWRQTKTAAPAETATTAVIIKPTLTATSSPCGACVWRNAGSISAIRPAAGVSVCSCLCCSSDSCSRYTPLSLYLAASGPRMSCAERKPSRFVYSMILVTTPAPTVRPPSRIANRNPSSIAIGAINSIDIFVLSPGITISTPSGISTLPVTSVVRK